METKRVLKCLNIGEKVKIIKEVEKGIKRKKEIAAEYNIPASTLSTILKNKNKTLKNFEESCLPQRKKIKISHFPELEDTVLKWIHKVRDQNLPISGPLVQEKARQFAKELGIDCQGSSGWLHKFKERNSIVSRIISGESAAVSDTACEEYTTNILPGLIEKYNEKDIFNFDELGLFFKCLPDRTLTFKGEQCHGGKKSKERITVLVGANMTGTEKSKLLVIGKSQKPRCFKNVKSLPVQYEFNKKAWMTSMIYESFLYKMDEKFVREKRRVLFFFDNCAAHPKIIKKELKAIKVVFFPPNMTSKLQPMDQGVIKNLKHHYRKKVMQTHLRKLERNEDINDVNLLECIHMLHSAWQTVSESTIANCFRKAGFIKENNEIGTNDGDEENIPDEWLEVQRVYPEVQGIAYNEFLDFDSDLATSESYTDAEILNESIKCHKKLAIDGEEDNESGDEEDVEAELPISAVQAENYVQGLRKYTQGQPEVSDEIFSAINILDNFIQRASNKKEKQMKITSFLQKKKLVLQ